MRSAGGLRAAFRPAVRATIYRDAAAVSLAGVVAVMPVLDRVWLAAALGLVAVAGVVVLDRVRAPGSARSVAPRGLRSRRRVAMAVSGAASSLFRGRLVELAALVAEHDRQRMERTTRDPAGVQGPVVLAIHGKPGVGKSSLAKQLARQVAEHYPDGILYANLGTAGGARAPSEVLGVLLDSLGWDAPSPAELPPTDCTLERAQLFRTLTADRRILLILDAARHAEQVRMLLPAGAGCAVIVTSRRDLATPLDYRSYLLEVPSIDDCLQILRATTQTEDHVRPICAQEIVELCGRLPLAIRSAGERVSMQDADLCQIADLLRSAHARLTWLDFNGRSLHERFESEYRRLLPAEQRALRMLTLIRSNSFVPWLAGPLLDIRADEAENMVGQLSASQLLDNLGRDNVTNLARYAFNPLIRRFIEGEVTADESDARDAARQRLAVAYIGAVSQVLAALDPAARDLPVGDTSWFPYGMEPAYVATVPRRWVRAEYSNLLHTVRVAYEQQHWSLAARLAVWLGGTVRADDDTSTVIDVFGLADDAADRIGDAKLRLDLRLSRASFLIALERYADAESVLYQIGPFAHRDDASGSDERNEPVATTPGAWRLMGESCLQAGAYGDAAWMLEYATRLAEAANDEHETRLVQLLQSDNHQVSTPWAARALDTGEIDENTQFRIHLSSAEAAQRGADWDLAQTHLQQAATLCQGDSALAAQCTYRRARMYLRRWHSAMDVLWPAAFDTDPLLVQAIRLSAAAAAAWQRIGNPVGELRVRILLVRALAAAGQCQEAEQILADARRALARLRAPGSIAFRPLRALLRQADGELALRRNEYRRGRSVLSEAAGLFADLHDWTAEREAQNLLRLAERVDPHASAPASGEAAVAWGDGWADLTDERVDELASVVAHEVEERLAAAAQPPAPVAFYGVLGIGMDGVLRATPDNTQWQLPLDAECRLTIALATGRRHHAGGQALLPDLPGQTKWQPVAVVNGRKADVVQLDLVVDAPFLDVAHQRWHLQCRVEDAIEFHHSAVRVPHPGTYEVRVSLFCAGRLVQVLPVDVVAEAVAEVG